MNDFKSGNSIFIVFTGVIIAFGRYLLGEIDTKLGDGQHILIVMAVVNYIALGLVLLFLHNDFCRVCKSKISSSGMDTNLKKKCHYVVLIISSLLSLVYLVFGILYIIEFKTSNFNDVISIIALTVSIAASGLVEDCKDGYYRLVLKIAKLKIRNKKKENQGS